MMDLCRIHGSQARGKKAAELSRQSLMGKKSAELAQQSLMGKKAAELARQRLMGKKAAELAPQRVMELAQQSLMAAELSRQSVSQAPVWPLLFSWLPDFCQIGKEPLWSLLGGPIQHNLKIIVKAWKNLSRTSQNFGTVRFTLTS